MPWVCSSGWNGKAALLGPFWYLGKGMKRKGLVLLAVSLFTAGLGIIPVWVYCGFNGNQDYYKFIRSKGYNIP